MNELERIEREIHLCLNGVRDDSRHGDDWLWLLGWADWSVEKQLLEEKYAEDVR